MAQQSDLNKICSQHSSQTAPLSSHRLPTVSASQALQHIQSAGPQVISTGLPHLDLILAGQTRNSASKIAVTGGLVRGKVTEVYGPPGSGKSAFGLQTVTNALKDGGRALWIAASSALHRSRSNRVMLQAGLGEDDITRRFHHVATPTLSHLLAFILQPPQSFPPPGTTLIVIDSISTLFDTAYPKNTELRSGVSSQRAADAAKWAAGRRFAVMSVLLSTLGKVAALCNIAVLVTTQTMTRVRTGLGALLLPAISSTEWTNGIATQLVLFRDWPPYRESQLVASEQKAWQNLRYAGIIKVNGALTAEEGQFELVVPFTIGEHGIKEVEMPSSRLDVSIASSPTRAPKRSFIEVADSEDDDGDITADEDFGWVDEDELAAEGLIITEDTLPDETPEDIEFKVDGNLADSKSIGSRLIVPIMATRSFEEHGLSSKIFVPAQAARAFVEGVMSRNGVPRHNASVVASALVQADLRGVDSHGINRIPSYMARIRAGVLDPQAEPKIQQITPVVAQVDGCNGFGFVAAHAGMAVACQMAAEYGVGMVSVKHSNHFGMSAWLVQRALDAGMMSLVFTNSSPALPVWGGVQKLMGVSPIACGAPAGSSPPFILDMAPSVAARGKIHKALRRGESIPEGWALDGAGNPTTDAAAALQGVMLPMGGPKGSALAIMMDVFSGAFSGSAFAGGVGNPYDPSRPADVGHFLLAIKPDLFMSLEDFKGRMDHLYRTVVDAQKAPGTDRIYFPGEIEHLSCEERSRTGIPYTPAEIGELNEEARRVGAPLMEIPESARAAER